MNIIEVISVAKQEDPIYFLLTAYVEAAWHEPAPHAIPGWVLRLPLNGKHDVRARFEALARESEAAHGDPADRERGKVTEALAVFGSAVERLGALENGDNARARSREMSLA